MARKPSADPTSANVAARLKALKIAKATKLVVPSKFGVRQAISPMTAAQTARMASIRAAARAVSGR